MLPRDEKRFLSLARRLEFLDQGALKKAVTAAASPERGERSLPTYLVEKGFLTEEQHDRVLRAMVGLIDRTAAQGDELRRDKKMTRALERYDKALDSDPEHEGSLRGRAETLIGLKRLEDAVKGFQALLKVTTRRAEVLHQRGRVLADLERYEEARADLEESIVLDPEKAGVRFDLGTCHHRAGRLDEAIACYTSAIEIDGSHIEAHNNRAIAHLLGRDVVAAQNDWKACLAIDRKRRTIRRNLQAVLARFKGAR